MLCNYICPKMDLGLEIQKISFGIRIRILEIPWVQIFRKNEQFWLFAPKFGQNMDFRLKFRKKMLK